MDQDSCGAQWSQRLHGVAFELLQPIDLTRFF